MDFFLNKLVNELIDELKTLKPDSERLLALNEAGLVRLIELQSFEELSEEIKKIKKNIVIIKCDLRIFNVMLCLANAFLARKLPVFVRMKPLIQEALTERLEACENDSELLSKSDEYKAYYQSICMMVTFLERT